MRDCTTFLSHSIAFLHLVIQHFYNLSYGVFFFFLESWQNWLVWIWMRAEVGVSQSLVSRMALSECDERVLFLDFRRWNASSRKALVESLIRNLHCTRGDFFFLSLRLRRRRKKNDTKLILIHFDAQDRSGGVLHPCTCHLLESDRLLFSQRFLSPDRIN